MDFAEEGGGLWTAAWACQALCAASEGWTCTVEVSGKIRSEQHTRTVYIYIERETDI